MILQTDNYILKDRPAYLIVRRAAVDHFYEVINVFLIDLIVIRMWSVFNFYTQIL